MHRRLELTIGLDCRYGKVPSVIDIGSLSIPLMGVAQTCAISISRYAITCSNRSWGCLDVAKGVVKARLASRFPLLMGFQLRLPDDEDSWVATAPNPSLSTCSSPRSPLGTASPSANCDDGYVPTPMYQAESGRQAP